MTGVQTCALPIWLYPNFKKEEHYNDIVKLIAVKTFKTYKLKENGYRLGVIIFIALTCFNLINYLFLNLGAYLYVGFAFFVIFVILQRVENFVFENKF